MDATHRLTREEAEAKADALIAASRTERPRREPLRVPRGAFGGPRFAIALAVIAGFVAGASWRTHPVLLLLFVAPLVVLALRLVRGDGER